MKKLAIIGAVIIVLFAALIILTNISNQKQIEENLSKTENQANPYGKTDLDPATIDLLDNEHYQNIILPDELKEKIASGAPVVAYMFSSTCPHCMNFTPNLMPIADEMGIPIDQYNPLEFDEGWDEYEVVETPTLIYFKDGKEVDRIVGDYSNDLDGLKTFLNQVENPLKNNPYGKTSLQQSTIDLLDNENYQNIILPEDLEEKIASGDPVMAYMFSPECPHCLNFTPNLIPIANELGVEINQYNLLEFPQGWNDYKVEYTPTLIFFKDGKAVGEPLVGDYSDDPEKVKAFLEQAKQ